MPAARPIYGAGGKWKQARKQAQGIEICITAKNSQDASERFPALSGPAEKQRLLCCGACSTQSMAAVLRLLFAAFPALLIYRIPARDRCAYNSPVSGFFRQRVCGKIRTTDRNAAHPCRALRAGIFVNECGVMPVAPKTVLCIHDLPGFGRAGLAVIVPILSALGLQAVALPTAVLSPTRAGWAPRPPFEPRLRPGGAGALPAAGRAVRLHLFRLSFRAGPGAAGGAGDGILARGAQGRGPGHGRPRPPVQRSAGRDGPGDVRAVFPRRFDPAQCDRRH